MTCQGNGSAIRDADKAWSICPSQPGGATTTRSDASIPTTTLSPNSLAMGRPASFANGHDDTSHD